MRSLSRRGLLRVVVVSGVAGPVAFAMTGRADAEVGAGSVVAGTVVSAGPDGVVVRTASETINVVAAAGATLYSGASGLVSSTSAFQVGDRVGAEGSRNADHVVATKIGSIFTPIHARVDRISADGTIAETSAGPVLLAAGQLPQQSPADGARRAQGVSPGAVLRGLGWTDPGTGERYLLVRG